MSTHTLPEFTTPEVHSKGWGEELWIVNNNKYCGKLLKFKGGSKFSMHFHAMKHETWYVLEGTFTVGYIDPNNAEHIKKNLSVGDVVVIPPNLSHQLETTTVGTILEVSTQHFEDDSYRVMPGDSQK
jgi:mannose-6-phosphate isomerase-like protein (cupin superfamily)